MTSSETLGETARTSFPTFLMGRFRNEMSLPSTFFTLALPPGQGHPCQICPSRGTKVRVRPSAQRKTLLFIFFHYTLQSTLTMDTTTKNQPVSFTTQTPYPLPSQKFMIPTTWRRYHLSQLVNKALSLERPVPFDFLVRGQMLRGTIQEWCAENGVGEVRKDCMRMK